MRKEKDKIFIKYKLKYKAIFIKYKTQGVYCCKKKQEDYVKRYPHTFKGDLCNHK